jgi:ABC-type amino acid transport substrate-binding protein
MEEDGHIRGIDVEVLEAISRQLGRPLKVQLMPWKRMEAMLTNPQSGISCAFAMSRTPARERYLVLGEEPLHVTRYTLFIRVQDRVALRSLDRFQHTVVGVRRGFRLPGALTEAVQQGRVLLEEVDQDEVNFRKLALGRVQAVLTNLDVGHYTLAQLRLSGIVPQDEPLMRLPTFIAYTREAKGLPPMADIDAALRRLKQDGTYARIVARYLNHLPAARSDQATP